MTFTELNKAIRDFEENEKALKDGESSSVMAAMSNNNRDRHFHKDGGSNKKVICYSCGVEGHKSNQCSTSQNKKKWCRRCKSNTHTDKSCHKNKGDKMNSYESANVVSSGKNNEFHSFYFK